MMAQSPEYQSRIFPIVAIVFISTAVFPVICTLAMRAFKMISSLNGLTMSDRQKPLIFVSIFYTLTSYMLWDKGIFSSDFMIIFLSVNLLVLLLTGISFFWRISIYSASISLVVGLFLAINLHSAEDSSLYWPLLYSILAAGTVMSLRMTLNTHSPTQIYLGSILGLLIGYVPMAYLFVMSS